MVMELTDAAKIDEFLRNVGGFQISRFTHNTPKMDLFGHGEAPGKGQVFSTEFDEWNKLIIRRMMKFNVSFTL